MWKRPRVDDDGFLSNLEDWDEKVAQGLAEREGVGQLNDEHMEIVKFMHSYYKKYHAFPILSYVCKTQNKPLKTGIGWVQKTITGLSPVIVITSKNLLMRKV